MNRQVNEPAWRIGVKRALRTAGRAVPLKLQYTLVRHRPALTWIIQPGKTVHFDRFLQDYTVQVDTSSKIERQMLSGVYEPHLLRAMREYIKPGMTILDIGANVGAMTLAMMQCAGPAGRVHAFEPADHLYQRLCRNRELNPPIASAIHAHNIALGRTPGELFWLQSSAGPGNGRLIDHDAPGASRVKVTTLDLWRREANIDRVDFIKMDVERMELDVVQGGMITLAEFRPVMLFETLPCAGRDDLERRTRELLQRLRRLDYELFSVGRRGMTRIAADELPRAHESMAIPK